MKIADRLKDARSAAKKGQTQQAVNQYNRVLSEFPANKMAIQGLVEIAGGDATKKALNTEYFSVNAYMNAGQLETAEKKGRALVKKHPKIPEFHVILGTVLSNRNKPKEGAECFRRARKLDPMSITARQNLSKALLTIGEPEEAIEVVNELVKLDPNNALSYRRKASAQRLAGDMAGCQETLETALKRFPKDTLLLELLAVVKKYEKADDPDIERLASVLDTSELAPKARRKLTISYARSLESAGAAERAVAAYKVGNAMRKNELEYDFSNDKKQFEIIRSHFKTPLPPLQSDDGLPNPIFIVGMPRSGTSLTEQIIASHSQVHGAGELGFWGHALKSALIDTKPSSSAAIGSDGLKKLRKDYREILAETANGKPYVTDKMPSNFRWVPVLAAVFPDAPILHMRRDPRATCWSIWKLPFPASGLGFAFDADDLVAYYKQYESLMNYWDELLPGRVDHVVYEYLTENQESETRRLLDICGLPWEDDTLEFHKADRSVATASTAQVRQKMYKGSSEAWRKFAPHLPELFEAFPEYEY